MRRIGVMLMVAAVAAAGCGARATVPTLQPASNTSTETTIDEPVEPIDPAPVSGSTTTSTSDAPSPAPAEPPDVAVGEIDLMLLDIDETLAELDQLLNDAAAALAAEEGEILP